MKRTYAVSVKRDLAQALRDLGEARKALARVLETADRLTYHDEMVAYKLIGAIMAEASNGLIMSGRGDELRGNNKETK